MTEAVRIPVTAAQLRRIQQLQQNALQAAAMRDAVLSGIIEGVIDQDLTGWSIALESSEIVLTPPAPMLNGVTPISQADVMSP